MPICHYGKDFDIDYLRQHCCITNKGVSLFGMGEAAECIGLHAVGLKIPTEILLKKINLPCVIYWNNNHFVVLYKIASKHGELRFYIADPVGSYYDCSLQELESCWLSSKNEEGCVGVVLDLTPTPLFYQHEEGIDVKNDSRRNSISYLFKYLKPYKTLIAQLVVGLATGALLQMIIPLLTQTIVDYGISNQDLNFVYIILIAQLVLVLSAASVEFFRGWILLHIGARVNISLISDYLTKMMRLPISFFDTKTKRNIMQRINDHSRIQHQFGYIVFYG